HYVFDRKDVFAASVAEFIIGARATRLFWIGTHFVFAVSRLAGDDPHVSLLSEFGFSCDLECFDLAIGKLMVSGFHCGPCLSLGDDSQCLYRKRMRAIAFSFQWPR